MEKIKYTTLIDYIMFTLYNVKLNSKNKFLSLIIILECLDYELSYSSIVELGKYLETRGWAKVVFIIGDVRLQISPSGVAYIEEKSKEEHEEYKKYLNNLTETKGARKLLIFDDEEPNPKTKIITLIDTISKKIKEKEGHETDLNKDLEIIKIEIQKLSPDFKLIEEKLSHFNNLGYLFNEIQELKEYLLVDDYHL